MLCHDLLLIEAWRNDVFLHPVARVPEERRPPRMVAPCCSTRPVPNMPGPFLNHEHACKVMDKAPLLEITDICMRNTMRLHYRPRDDEVGNLKLPTRAPPGARALGSSWALGRLWRPALSPTRVPLRRNRSRCIAEPSASLPSREVAPSADRGAPGDCPASALAQAVARSARAPPQAAAGGRKVLSGDGWSHGVTEMASRVLKTELLQC